MLCRHTSDCGRAFEKNKGIIDLKFSLWEGGEGCDPGEGQKGF